MRGPVGPVSPSWSVGSLLLIFLVYQNMLRQLEKARQA